ncbi:MAG: hypothetical protein P8J17_10675 [Halioglobus sp.]|nr:hypothetical protein [Halioglobus sp.]
MVGVKFAKMLLLSLCCVIGACDEGSGDKGSGGDGDSQAQVEQLAVTRAFKMGFTPWPFEATLDAVNTTYTLIQENGDIVAHHLTEGIPWEEALNRTAYPTRLNQEIDGRVSQTMTGKSVYLAIDSLSSLRQTMVGNWGENGQESRTAPWDTRSFADPEVIAAFTNFALDMIARFDTTYFNYATEANELFSRDPDAFNDFVVFARGVYTNIKRQHPDLPIMISIALKSPDALETSAFVTQFARIAEYVDVVGISAYPYAFYSSEDGSSPDSLPADWLSQIKSIAPNKPLAITETGWLAEDLVLPRFGISVSSNDAMQRDYVEKMLEEAQGLGVEFVVWFTVVDFDALWNGVLGQADLPSIWRDTGLYDQTLRPRAALDTWQEWLSRPQTATE